MKLQYFPETDSLHIQLSAEPCVDSHVLGNGIVLYVDAQGHLTSITIEQASQKPNVCELIVSNALFSVHTIIP